MQYEELCNSKIIRSDQIDQNQNFSSENGLRNLIGEMKDELNNNILDGDCSSLISIEVLEQSQYLDEVIVELIKMEKP